MKEQIGSALAARPRHVPTAHTRRAVLAGAGAAGTMAAVGVTADPAAATDDVSTGGESRLLSVRLPDPALEILDHAAAAPLFNTLSSVERLATGIGWAEGPVWCGEAGVLLLSDVRGNRILRWDPVTGTTDAFRADSNFANGNCLDRQGRLLSCEGLTRRVTRTELDGSVSGIAERFDGKRLNSPNDILCRSDGTVFFTDPRFGPNFAEGLSAPELPANLYRLDPGTGKLRVAAGDVPGPNGLAFSPDEARLYVVASRNTPNRQIWVYDVALDGTLSNRSVLLDCGSGTADGIKVDSAGNVWAGWGMGEGRDGVVVVSPAGKIVARLHLPERCANLCFGGVHRNELFMAAHTSLYRLVLSVQGAKVV